jgi:integrase
LDGDASIMLSSTTKLNNNQKDEDEEKMMKKEDYMIFFDRKIEIVTAGLRPYCNTILYKLSKDNALTIADYVISMKSEINLSDHYRADVIKLLCNLSIFCGKVKPFKQMTREEDVLAFLDSFRRPESSDPLHKWIGTYNLYIIHLMRFFKWLYYPDIEPSKRPKPPVIENIPKLKRKEQSIYKPSDLWTAEDDLLFLKYCPSKRMKCYHAVAKDTSCRPHELLKLRIKDVVFKTATTNSGGTYQYAEVLVNGKTGSRHIPLINSIPYVKDYLDHEHPYPGNPNAVFLCGNGKSLGRVLVIESIEQIYKHYKTDLFPKLLDDPSVPPEDKQRIRDLLKKPWNPYIRRHSALTEKSTKLKLHTLNQHAGWSINSHMAQKYIHYFGNESSESLLEAYGIIPKDHKASSDVLLLKPKQCPNCSEPNKVDSKFCTKCRMILTYDAYSEVVEEKQEKDDALVILSDQVMKLMAEVQELKKQK